jgi:hypothetical protein
MRNSPTTIGNRSDTGAAILLGSVLGLILGGALVTGFCGWRLWAANASAAGSTLTNPPSTTVPSPTYASPPNSSDQSSKGYRLYPATSLPNATGQPTSGDLETFDPYQTPAYSNPYNAPASQRLPSPTMPSASADSEADSYGQISDPPSFP